METICNWIGNPVLDFYFWCGYTLEYSEGKRKRHKGIKHRGEVMERAEHDLYRFSASHFKRLHQLLNGHKEAIKIVEDLEALMDGYFIATSCKRRSTDVGSLEDEIKRSLILLHAEKRRTLWETLSLWLQSRFC